jgi:hypothetical protein
MVSDGIKAAQTQDSSAVLATYQQYMNTQYLPEDRHLVCR